MAPFRPIFGNFDENQTRRKQTSDISFQSFRFHNSKETVMNFTKYIVVNILEKFKYLAKQIIFSNSPTLKL